MNNIQYIFQKNAPTTLIFLHGWCCSPYDYLFQIAYFKKEYSILLPNYSQTVLDFKLNSEQLFLWCVSELKTCIESYQLKNFILIGHSMGGIMALALSEYFKTQSLGCVIIDTAMPLSQERRQSYNALITELNTDQGKDVLAAVFDKKWVNLAHDNASLMIQKKTEMLSMWNQSRSHFTQLLLAATQFDSVSAIKNYTSPLMYIAAEPANGDIMALRQLNPKLQVAQIQSGHFIMQNAPEALNPKVPEFYIPGIFG